MRVNVYSNGPHNGATGLALTGGSINGELVLYNAPTLPLEAATKGYADAAASGGSASSFTTGTIPVTLLPAFSGDLTSTAGSSTLTLSSTGVSPGTYSNITVDAAGRVVSVSFGIPDSRINTGLNWSKVINLAGTLSGYGITDAATSGSTLTGPLTIPAPTSALHMANKDYVDTVITPGGDFVTGDIVRKATSTTPVGFLRCNGAIVDQATYSALYAVIGNTYGGSGTYPGSGKPWKQQYEFNTNTATDIAAWTTSANSLSVGLGYSQVIVTKNRVYLLGGIDSVNNGSNSYTAPINPDGTLGTWTTYANALPVTLVYSQAIVTKNRVYLLGGWNGANYISTVYTAPINVDGTLGTWTTSANSLPTTLGNSQAIITTNRVYLLGGYNGSGYTSAVYTALINVDGTLGAWTTSVNSLPGTLGGSQAIVTNNRVYLLGGFGGTSSLSAIYSAPINLDGTLGTWTTSVNSLPGTLSGSQAVVTNNRVYLLGGYRGTSAVTGVYTAPINIDGTLGTWTTSANSLPGVLAYSQAIVTSSRVYLLGGYIGSTYTSTVYEAPFTGGLDDYSPYYDGTNQPVNFKLPDTTVLDSLDSIYSYIKY